MVKFLAGDNLGDRIRTGLWALVALIFGVVASTFASQLTPEGQLAAAQLQDLNRDGCDGVDYSVGDDGLAIATGVRPDPETCFSALEVGVRVGDVLNVRLEFTNLTHEQVDDVVVRVYLADGLEVIDNTTQIMNSNAPEGQWVGEDTIAEQGLNIGSYGPSANALLVFDVRVSELGESETPCAPAVSLVWGQASTPSGSSPWSVAALLDQQPCDLSP